MITLTHGQAVKSENWLSPFICTVFTIEGYTTKDMLNRKADPIHPAFGGELFREIGEALVRANSLGHEIAATISIGSSITRDYPGKAEKLTLERTIHDHAVVLRQGDVVMIEGRTYTVHYNQGQRDRKYGPSLSDPIRFIPVA